MKWLKGLLNAFIKKFKKSKCEIVQIHGLLFKQENLTVGDLLKKNR